MTTVQEFPQIKGVKNIPLPEQFTSGATAPARAASPLW